MRQYHFLKASLRRVSDECRKNPVQVLTAALLVLSLYVGTVMLFFGMNFWLWSFTPGIKRSYSVMFIASLSWCILFIFTVFIHWLYNWFWNRKVENYFFWVNRRGVLLLFLIGAFDSLTGLTASYSSIHVPQILQSALISTGPIWTFILAYFFFPSSQPKFNLFLLIVPIFIIGGVVFATIPQVLDKSGKNSYFHLPWILIYLLGTALFPLYNVIQGRFSHEFKDHASSLTCKLVMLCGETTIQFILCIMYFPIDFSPFFGKCTYPKESWDNFIESLSCIYTCKNNAIYMLIYVMGFYIRHIVFAYLNSYSPSVAAITSMLTQPINAFLLLVIPSWNVYGSKKDWRCILGSFLCLLIAMLTFMLWHITFKTLSNESYGDDEDIEDEKNEAK
ncbi:unnamed protein product [Phytomonas sp. EM1]|nr:unnamed protein product [Phytomonas sp. EM1]|eukprot:CCW63354.1 unnamed protein product [Phytomonas sp. isolate EM1]